MMLFTISMGKIYSEKGIDQNYLYKFDDCNFKRIVYDFLPNILIILFLEFAFSWLMIDENEKEIVEDLVDGVAQEGRRWGLILP